MKIWLAKDKNGGLYAYSERPSREGNIFLSNGNLLGSLKSEAFPEVTWKNSPRVYVIRKINENKRQGKNGKSE